MRLGMRTITRIPIPNSFTQELILHFVTVFFCANPTVSCVPVVLSYPKILNKCGFIRRTLAWTNCMLIKTFQGTQCKYCGRNWAILSFEQIEKYQKASESNPSSNKCLQNWFNVSVLEHFGIIMGQYISSTFSIVEPCGNFPSNPQTNKKQEKLHNQIANASMVQEEVPLDPLEVHHHEMGPTPSLGPTKLIPEAAAKPWRSHGMCIRRQN